MPLQLDAVQEYAKVPGSQAMRLVRTRPAMRFCAENQPPIWVQEGVLYFEGGDKVPLPAPLWFFEEVKRITKEACADVGLTDAVLRTLGSNK